MEIEKRFQLNKTYQAKLVEVKKEERRHLLASKKVPRTYQHVYEMDLQSEKQLQAMRETVDDLRSVGSSPEREAIPDGTAGT